MKAIHFKKTPLSSLTSDYGFQVHDMVESGNPQTHPHHRDSVTHKNTGMLSGLLPGQTWEEDTMRLPNYPLLP